MSGTRSAEESKADHVAAMGTELGEFYSALWQELAWTHSKWAEYITLFGTSSARIDLLNQAAPRFFRTIQDSLWEDVLLHVARLTDSPRSAGKENLSIRRLPTLAVLADETELSELVDRAVESAAFARDWRNRRIAHRDLSLALGKPVESLAPASRQAVKGALKELVEVMNWLASKFLDSTTMYESHDPDAEALLYVLRDGLRHDAERRERIASRTFRPEDLKPDPL